MAHLTFVGISDSASAQALLDGIRKRWHGVERLLADGAYDWLKLMVRCSLWATRMAIG